MRELPILFSGPMVRAIQNNWKTETRRLIRFRLWASLPVTEMTEHNRPFKDSPREEVFWSAVHQGDGKELVEQDLYCPYGVPGDRLWVREGHRFFEAGNGVDYIQYRADEESLVIPNTEKAADYVVGKLNENWRPSIFMPRWASRIILEVKEVRVERVQDITEEGALAEGFLPDRVALGNAGVVSARRQFMHGWDSLNEKRGPWKSNPWVWVVTFRRIE